MGGRKQLQLCIVGGNYSPGKCTISDPKEISQVSGALAGVSSLQVVLLTLLLSGPYSKNQTSKNSLDKLRVQK